MSVKQVYTFGLISVFLMWGTLGFAFEVPRRGSLLQVTSTPLSSPLDMDTQSSGIPVTGKTEPVLTEILVFYGLIGLTALFLILALLHLANKSTVQPLQHKTSSPGKTRQN